MKKISLIFALGFCLNSLAQQNRAIDSLNKLLSIEKKDSSKVNLQNELAKIWLKNKEIDSAEVYAEHALDLAKKITFRKGMASAYNNMAAIEESQEKFSEAIQNYNEVLKITFELDNKHGMAQAYHNLGVMFTAKLLHAEAIKKYLSALKIRKELLSALLETKRKKDSTLIKNRQTEIASTLNNLGNSYKDIGNYAEALKSYLEALLIAEEIKSKYGIALLNNNIGIIYKEQGNNKDALKHYLAAKNMKEELGQTNDKHYSNMLSNVGNIYNQQGKLDEALQHYEKALAIRTAIGDKSGIAASYHSLASNFLNRGKYNEALEKYLAGLKIREEIEDKAGIVASYIDIGSLYKAMNKNKEAFEYLQNGLKQALSIRHLEWTKNAYLNLANLDSVEAAKLKKEGKFKDATEYFCSAFNNYKMHVAYKDSLLSEEASENIARIQMAYELETGQGISELDNVNLKPKTEQSSERGLFISAGLAMLILVIATILWGRNQNKKYKQVMAEQKRLNEERIDTTRSS